MILVDRQDYKTTDRGDGYEIGEISQISELHPSFFETGMLVGSFDGLQTALRYIKEKMPEARRGGSSDDRGRDNFHYYDNFQEALDTYLNNPSSVRDFDENDVKIDGGDASGNSVDYEKTGDFIDVSRFIEGDPDVFGYMTNGAQRNKYVTLFFSINWQAGVDHDYINLRSKRIVRLVDWLESQHIRCQVVGIRSNDCMHVEYRVKEYYEPIDLNDIAVSSHSDFLRRINFRVSEYSKTHDSGYGYSRATNEWVRSGRFEKQLEKGEMDGGLKIYVGNNEHEDIDGRFDILEKDIAKILSEEDDFSKLIKIME